ncbi:MFS transporter [Mesorhizobium sp. LjRoot246]|uniref:MFS transporter n=1 Tax=Mesorhizobium sp. LjRoot246 TaxID=3342294 RepID=UPI003ECD6630
MTRDKSNKPTTMQTGETVSAPNAVSLPYAILVFLTALSVLPVNIYLPSLPGIAVEFDADFALVNFSVAGYAIVTALTGLISGALSDRFGRRPVVLTALTIFIVASAGCAFASSIEAFLLFRMMQASIAACFSVALVIIKETSGEREATSRIGYAAMGWAIAPMLGPTLGGVLDELFGWRSIFVVLGVLGAAMLVFCMRYLRETAAPSKESARNYLASYLQLLGSVRFWAFTLCMACSMGTFYIFLGGAPLAMNESVGGSSAILGLYMGMVPTGFILGSFLSGRYGSGHARGAVLVFARLLTCLGLFFGLILSISGSTHALAFFIPCMFIGIGNGLTMPTANVGVLSVRADLAGTAAGLAAAMSIGGGALIATIAGLFLKEAGAARLLLGILLTSASLALLAALFAAFVDRSGFKPAVEESWQRYRGGR